MLSVIYLFTLSHNYRGLNENNIKCGIALFGETIFSMIPQEKENEVLGIIQKYSDGIIIKSELDNDGARVLLN